MKFTPHFILILLFLFFIEGKITAQLSVKAPVRVETTNNDSIDVEETDEEEDEIETDTVLSIPRDLAGSLDGLLNSWAIERNGSENCKPRPNPFVTEELFKERLKKLPYEIEMPYNSAVRSFIDILTEKRRPHLETMLGLQSYYFPIFEEALEASKLPLELKYLPIIESSLNPTAVSRAGASGLWQFMIGTGRLYGLDINTLVDERLDPVKSSKVAVRYLKDLFSIYSDWHLVIAAYNCGPGNVNKAIRRANGKRDFWAIYPYLPAETRAYVPVFIAANYAMHYADEHNLCPRKIRLPVMTDTITVNNRIHLQQIASVLNLPIDELRLLNPQYRRDIVPGDIKAYPICLPLNYANLLIDKMDDVLAYRADDLVNNRRSETEILPVAQHKARPAKGKVTYYKVKKGQTLSGIAQRHGVSVAALRKANGMGKKSNIRIGQRIKIPHK